MGINSSTGSNTNPQSPQLYHFLHSPKQCSSTTWREQPHCSWDGSSFLGWWGELTANANHIPAAGFSFLVQMEPLRCAQRHRKAAQGCQKLGTDTEQVQTYVCLLHSPLTCNPSARPGALGSRNPKGTAHSPALIPAPSSRGMRTDAASTGHGQGSKE